MIVTKYGIWSIVLKNPFLASSGDICNFKIGNTTIPILRITIAKQYRYKIGLMSCAKHPVGFINLYFLINYSFFLKVS